MTESWSDKLRCELTSIQITSVNRPIGTIIVLVVPFNVQNQCPS